MRLEKIKLSGFKSFVDPITIPLPVNLVGIVGPNGCGKSNVIDAVRWVMGESSAKNLRGGSMADVIFNGSTARKPISKATVELVFDNSDSTVGGEYSQYSQLSIKRQVTRDGQSIYRLNGAKCRRRDITDIFLGTGLGPRSYAIIEQGMISRLIEAKPEELRVFLEEAAGVSKYKERRHETEIRMRHTRENIERLDDLIAELDLQAEKLKRQVKVAERYKNLRAKERLYKRELYALSWQRFDSQYQIQHLEILQSQSSLEKTTTAQQQFDIKIEESRALYKEQQVATDKVQRDFYELGAEIVRLEQKIHHAKSLIEQADRELLRASEEQLSEQETLTQEKQQLATFQLEKIKIDAELKTAIADEKKAKEGQTEITQQNQIWQTEWDQFITETSKPQQQLKSQQTRLQLLAQQQQALATRQQRLKVEQEALDGQKELEVFAQSKCEIERLHQQTEQLQSALEKLDQSVMKTREQQQILVTETNQSGTTLQSIVGRVAALEKIIAHATGRDRSKLNQWLKAQGLDDAPRFIEQIEVESGWEIAIEVVLSEFIEAICIDSSQPLLKPLNLLSKEGVALIEKRPEETVNRSPAKQLLLDKVHSHWALETLLGAIYYVDNLNEAYAQTSQLKSHESVITRDGTWLGKGWLLRRKKEDVTYGLLQKEKELKQLRKNEKQLAEALDQNKAFLQEALTKLQQLENEQIALRSDYNQKLKVLSSKESKLAGATTRLEHNKRRQERIELEQGEISREEKECKQNESSALFKIKESEQALISINQERERRVTQRDQLRLAQEAANQAAKKTSDTLHQLSARFDLLKTNESFTLKNIIRAEAQLRKRALRITEIKQPDNDSEWQLEALQAENQRLLEQKIAVDKVLFYARKRLSSIENETREMTEKRAFSTSDLNRQREILEKVRIAQEGSAVHAQTALQLLKEQGINPQEVLVDMQEGANEAGWNVEIELLTEKIERLGSINLVAIEEYDALKQRMHYLGEQHEDLSGSLSMLEQAISKIDCETKVLFKETFNKVNEGFQKRFPKLFGGGRAYLSLDDQDLLSTGISVMASPPGKRNSTIHLLSGGEKALTAIALVFSIFDLNPAPFCLLDEVDAPLDDANVGRFSELVKEMSDNVQFLFISHNKSTMEIAQHLTGITMSEPGVSRVVSVDIEEAVKLAAL